MFATNDEKEAFKRLKIAFPNYKLTKDICEPILKLVRDGSIRIGDPKMYNGNAPAFNIGMDQEKFTAIMVDWTMKLDKVK